MNITKERLLEIEKELETLTIRKLVSSQNMKNVVDHQRVWADTQVWELIHTCPHCNRSGKSALKRHHFDNCKLKGFNMKEFNKDLLRLSPSSILCKYKLSVEEQKAYCTYFNIIRTNNTEFHCDKCNGGGKGAKNIEFKCTHCNISGKGAFFNKRHFNNCRLKGVNLEQFNKDLSTTMTKDEICTKYNIDNNFIARYRRYFGIESNKHTEFKCPHCNRSGNGNNFIREHFDNCKLNGINLEQFNKDISTLFLDKTAKKYNLTRGYVFHYRKYFSGKA